MAQIRRSPAGPRLRLTAEEVQLLRKLADEVDALLSGRADADEFAPSDELPADDDRPAGDRVPPSDELRADDLAADDLAAGDPAASGGQSSPVPTAGELEAMTGLDWSSPESAAAPEDPALRRLLPDAYHDDPEAAADFRRYTEASLRGGKRADVTVVRQGLASMAITGERVLDQAQAQSWLRFLTDARLVLASRLGIEAPDDVEAYEQLATDDPRFMAYVVYEWLAPLLGDLVTALDAGSH
ncbi:MAG: DUF2017 domain-containing protein [Acidothermaceae bacterium]